MNPIEVHLPDHVLTLIMINLSVMQLMRMKCVCQRWLHLIRSPYFVRLHFEANRNNSDFFLATHPVFRPPFSRLSTYRSETLTLYNSIEVPDGVFAFCPTMSWSAHGLFGFYVNTDIVLCNPATRSYNEIPSITEFLSSNVEADGETRKTKRLKLKREFADVKTIGLGYSSHLNEFKLFAFIQVDRTYTSCVYNITWRAWTRLNHQFPLLTGTGVPCNGVLHWTARPRDGTFQPLGPALVSRNRYSIMTCDVTTNAFGEMSLPEGVLGNNLGLVNGSLAVFERIAREEYGEYACCIDVWSMPQYGDEDSWAQLYRVGPLGYNYCHFYWRDEALLCGSDHFDMDHRFEDELVSCNINHVIVGRLRIYFSQIRSYKESLISVEHPEI